MWVGFWPPTRGKKGLGTSFEDFCWLLVTQWPLWASRCPLVTISDATFGPLIPLDVTFEPRQALLGGPRPSRVMAPDQIESLRERKSDQTKQDDMIRRRNKKSIYLYTYI